MSILQKLGEIGSGVLSTMGPAGAIASLAINAFLDNDNQVNANTTADEFKAKLQSLPPDAQAQVSNAYYNYLADKEKYEYKTVAIKETSGVERLKAQIDGDKNGGTRPKIALMMAWTMVFMLMVISAGLAYDVVQGGDLPSWEQIMMLFGIPSWVIRSYFGDRSLDKVTTGNILAGGRVPQLPGIGAKIKAMLS